MDSIIQSITCPITAQIFKDPVITSDGHIYERSAIESWLLKKNTSPLTGLPITKNLLKCYAIKSIVKKYLSDNSDQKVNQFKILKVPKSTDYLRFVDNPEIVLKFTKIDLTYNTKTFNFTKRFFEKINYSNNNLIKHLIDNCIDINASSNSVNTITNEIPIYYIIKNCSSEMFVYLVTRPSIDLAKKYYNYCGGNINNFISNTRSYDDILKFLALHPDQLFEKDNKGYTLFSRINDISKRTKTNIIDIIDYCIRITSLHKVINDFNISHDNTYLLCQIIEEQKLTLEILQYLCELRLDWSVFDINKVSAYSRLIEKHDENLVKYFINDAINNGSINKISHIKGYMNLYPIHYIIRRKSENFVKWYIENVSVKLTQPDLNVICENGMSIMHYVMYYKQSLTLYMLQFNNVYFSLNSRDTHGMHTIHYAIQRLNNEELIIKIINLVLALKGKSSDPMTNMKLINFTDKYGLDCIHYCLKYNKQTVLMFYKKICF